MSNKTTLLNVLAFYWFNLV